MARFRVLLLEHGYSTTALEQQIISEAGGELIDAENLPEPETLRWCEEVDGILFRRRFLSADFIRRLRHCKGIVRYGVGTDNVDLAAATDARIIVGHVPGYCAEEVSDHALAMLLASCRQLVCTHAKMQSGGWDLRRQTSIHRLANQTIGLLGLGRIGRAVARKLSSWNVKIVAADPFVDPNIAAGMGVQLMNHKDVCAIADYLSLHLPLLPETRHLINLPLLRQMKPSATLINTARGPVVETSALIQALDEGCIAGAALDVFEEEPLPDNSLLRRHPRIIVSDHVAWFSQESQIELQQSAAREIATICLGRLPKSMANPEVLKPLGRWEEWRSSQAGQWQIKRLETL